ITGVDLTTAWTRTATGATREATTDANGIVDAATGFTLRTAPGRYAVTAKAGTLAPVTATIERYGAVTSLTTNSLLFNFAPVGGRHPSPTAKVITATAVEWTVIPAANGAGATFSEGRGAVTSVATAGSVAEITAPTFTANGIPGTFTLRARALGSSL